MKVRLPGANYRYPAGLIHFRHFSSDGVNHDQCRLEFVFQYRLAHDAQTLA
jgi:hypothetical protein